jgi:DNA-directed RNA polymerase specialized sigma24 family protein
MDPNKEPDMAALYKAAFPHVAKLVKSQGGDLEQAKDIFHDAFIIYLERINQEGFVIRTSPAAYIMGTARLLSIKAFNRKRDVFPVEWAENMLSIPGDWAGSPGDWAGSSRAGKEKDLLDHLKTVGGKCIGLLKAFYYENLDMQELSRKFGFKTSRSATVQKFKCLEKVREEVKNAAFYEEVIG